MHTLIITAHPSSKGFTQAIAGKFMQGITDRLDQGQQSFELINLYEKEWRQDFLTFENIKELEPDPVQSLIQSKITNADELVFIHPIWWGAMPAIMKNFIDQNLTAGFAYKYLKGGKIEKMMSTKSARVIITCDVPLWKYLFIGLPIMTSWFFPILDFCGFDVKSFTVFDVMRKRSSAELESWLENIYQISILQKRPFSIILLFFKIMSKARELLNL